MHEDNKRQYIQNYSTWKVLLFTFTNITKITFKNIPGFTAHPENREFILPYDPSQGGAGKAMVKQLTIVLSHILDIAVHKPSLLNC